ncbi:MAG: hypothetical protein JWQ90_1966 [Hydrocarboniphaga sp.]|uniref:hypothetical protein n=1 Tax=Hydrocarboniphaga sp. TaxID=2033016 RepID=UPI0026390717|nr:hypothetical protein [Hydrocarboniphaga sp.]MDB5969516.1 hypothetical protein [Hydrocarboniphaga sp.]
MKLQTKETIGTRKTRSAKAGALIAGLLWASAGGAATEGSSNNYFGTDAGGSGGTFNSFFGAYAGDSNTGDNNTATGADALYSNTSGMDNTASGAHALYSNTTGSYNMASGTAALYRNTVGFANSASPMGDPPALPGRQ